MKIQCSDAEVACKQVTYSELVHRQETPLNGTRTNRESLKDGNILSH